MKYRVVHRTRYDYSQPVVLCHNEAHLQPRATAAQTLPAEPGRRSTRCRRDVPSASDYFGNRVLYFAVQEPHAR